MERSLINQGYQIDAGRVTPLRVYSDAEIRDWLRDDRVTRTGRRRVLKKARTR